MIPVPDLPDVVGCRLDAEPSLMIRAK